MTDPDRRPDPDALLASLPRPRGRLKLFFGAAPGVGKTYAMLAEAQEKRAQGLDVRVVPGWAHAATVWALRALALEWARKAQQATPATPAASAAAPAASSWHGAS